MSPWDMEPIPEGSKYAFKNELKFLYKKNRNYVIMETNHF